MKIPNFLFSFLICFFIALYVGCAATGKKQDKVNFGGTYSVSENFSKLQPQTVAVVPFENLTDKDEAFEIVRKSFYNHFSSRNYHDVELLKVDNLLRKNGIFTSEQINNTPIEKLGEILNADVIIFGKITHYDRMYAVLYSQVAVGAELQMIDVKTGEVLWQAQDTSRIHEGGLSSNPLSLVVTATTTALNVRNIQLLRAGDDLFRDMVKTIPELESVDALKPPIITSMAHDSSGLTKKAGDKIKVVLTGDAGLTATFDIGDKKKSIALLEEKAGVYTATHTIMPGDNVDEAILTGYLTDNLGNTAKWIDALGPVTIDSTLPDPPIGLHGTGRDKIAFLSWNENKEKDLAGYCIYRSNTPLTGYEKLVTIETTQYNDTELENNKEYYYKIRSLDKAGNKSEFSKYFLITPIAPGPTEVGGLIQSDTIWRAGASPYIITEQITIMDKTSLQIEPGTVIKSKGAGIDIKGALIAKGSQNDIISFSLYDGQANSTIENWQGLSFSKTKDSYSCLEYIELKNAKTGINCTSSSPQISHSSISENTNAIVILDAFSTPDIIENEIYNNKETGIFISSAALPRIQRNKIRHNDYGIIVKQSSPTIIENDISDNKSAGIKLLDSETTLLNNNIYNNANTNLLVLNESEASKKIKASDNWWGSTDTLKIINTIQGPVNFYQILDQKYPDGGTISLPILTNPLPNIIDKDSYLILAESPYLINKELVIENKALLTIEPGVIINYEKNNCKITVKDGAIKAIGEKDKLIQFVPKSTTPSPGDYYSAINFLTEDFSLTSYLHYCSIQYAKNGLVVEYGKPDIAYCLIANNSESGVRVRNDATPKIAYCTIRNNGGMGGIHCLGYANPLISNSNIINNDWSIQSFSTTYINAKNNWWGADPPDQSQLIGHFVIDPWLSEINLDAPQ